MRQTTIRLPDELDDAVSREAHAAGMKKGEFMRLAIALHVAHLAGLRGDPTPLPPPATEPTDQAE